MEKGSGSVASFDVSEGFENHLLWAPDFIDVFIEFFDLILESYVHAFSRDFSRLGLLV